MGHGPSAFHAPPEMAEKVDAAFRHAFDLCAGQGRRIYGVETRDGATYRYR